MCAIHESIDTQNGYFTVTLYFLRVVFAVFWNYTMLYLYVYLRLIY